MTPAASLPLALIMALMLKAKEYSDVLSSLPRPDGGRKLQDSHAHLRQDYRVKSQRKLPCTFSFPIVVSVGRFATMKEAMSDEGCGLMLRHIAPGIM